MRTSNRQGGVSSCLSALMSISGNLSPLSGWSVVEVCVVPVLMYGLENWILNEPTTALLESLPPKIGKRLLKLPKWVLNSAVNVMMVWPTMKARILDRKLGFC